MELTSSAPPGEPFNVSIEKSGDVLRICYAGHVTPETAKQCLAEVKSKLASLQPQFRLLVDLSGLESMDPLCAEPIAVIMDLCNGAGVSRVARVVPDPARDIGLQIMSYFHYGPGVAMATCSTLDEAMKVLGG